MTRSSGKSQRVFEGHFDCGSGLLIESECLGRSYTSRTAGRSLSISIPRMPTNWQGDGFLDPPDWSYKSFSDSELEDKFSDAAFDWGVTSGFRNNDDGTQTPEFARVRRWGFKTKIDDASDKFSFFNTCAEAIREIEIWWDLVSSWVSIFTKQDFVEIGKTRSGIRVGPVMTWCGNAEHLRVNGSRETSIPIVNDRGVSRLDENTLVRCLTLAANGTQPPDEWILIRDARSLVNCKQYRRAVIDACTAAELSITALIDNKFSVDGTTATERKSQFDAHHGIAGLKTLHKNVGAAGQLPKRLIENVGATRNKAAHRGYSPTTEETNLAIDAALLVVEQAYPLAKF